MDSHVVSQVVVVVKVHANVTGPGVWEVRVLHSALLHQVGRCIILSGLMSDVF